MAWRYSTLNKSRLPCEGFEQALVVLGKMHRQKQTKVGPWAEKVLVCLGKAHSSCKVAEMGLKAVEQSTLGI